jgi:hypothetical protein
VQTFNLALDRFTRAGRALLALDMIDDFFADVGADLPRLPTQSGEGRTLRAARAKAYMAGAAA